MNVRANFILRENLKIKWKIKMERDKMGRR